jgi:hypothetical protein
VYRLVAWPGRSRGRGIRRAVGWELAANEWRQLRGGAALVVVVGKVVGGCVQFALPLSRASVVTVRLAHNSIQ